MDNQLCLREKLLWAKSLSGIHQMSANQCVKICQQGCTPDGSSFQIRKNSTLDITDLKILRTWSCLINKK